MTDKIVKAEISGLAIGGDCIGTVIAGNDDIIGKKIFLPYVIPGETITAKVTKEEKRILWGSLVNIDNKSDRRTNPQCKLFERCGGCELQHIEINAQRKYKKEMVLSMLEKQAGIKPESTEFAGDDLPAFNYRSRISLHLNENSELGFFRKNTSEVVDMDYCHISSETLNAALHKVRKYKKSLCLDFTTVILEESGGKIYLILKSREILHGYNEKQLPVGILKDFPEIKVQYKNEVFYSGIKDDYPAGHFSQVNSAGNQILIDIVLKHAGSKIVTDLYAGHGNFSIPLARSGKKVDLVEMDPVLVRYAKSQVQGSPWQDNLEYYTQSCEKFFLKNQAEETVILDPPRSGAKDIIKYFNNNKTKEIIYISCNLPSLCRDLKELKNFGYQLKKLYLVDMFSQTSHIETVAILSK